MVQIIYVMCDIYIYITAKERVSSSWGAEKGTHCTHSWEHTLGLNLGEEREELIESRFTHTITDWASSWTPVEHEIIFHNIN